MMALQSKRKVEFYNKIMNKKELEKLVLGVYNDFGGAKAGNLANLLKNLGFRYATLAGVTISIDDLDVPAVKKELMKKAEDEISHSRQRYLRGEITEVERYTKVIDTWAETNETLTKAVVENFDKLNSIYMMAFSGARGNLSQVRQLVGMRGLMADSQGQIIDVPIKTNFREGLSVTEYIISSYGARKGLVDTALKTADSGYLTRRLVDVAQDVIITEEDCGTQKGVLMSAISDGTSIVVKLEDRIVSRSSAVDIVNPQTGEVIVQAGEVMTEAIAQAIKEAGIESVLVRSGLTCETNFGICQKCYGWSLTTNKLVDQGEAIGIMAAQSIGEPGTQLTMRTFHTGGVFSGGVSREIVKAKEAGSIKESIPVREFRTRHGDVVSVATRDDKLVIQTAKGKTDVYQVPFGATLYFTEKGSKIEAGQAIFEYDPSSARGNMNRLTEKATKDITADLSGKVRYEGFEADEKRDRQGNISRTSNRSGTIWVLGGDVYNLPAGSDLKVSEGQSVFEADVLAETMLFTEYGGEVRLPEDLVTIDGDVNNDQVKIIESGKELTVVIASVSPANADFVQTKKEMLWQVADEAGEVAETYVIKAPQGTSVENGSIIAELVDDSVSVPTSGEIRYEGVEIDEQQIITKAGKILFIPEEIHQVSKDISLKAPGLESGMLVKAGTELVNGIHARIDGVVHFVEENDIIHEVIVRPGELYRVDEVKELQVEDGTIVEAGEEVAPNIKASVRSLVTITYQIDDAEDSFNPDTDDTSSLEYAEVLIRPVYEYDVAPREVNIEFSSTEEEHIRVIPVTQLQATDGAKLRSVEGTSLLRTSLVLQMGGFMSRLKGVTELQPLTEDENELKVVVLENITIRHSNSSESMRANATKTMLLVEQGDIIEKNQAVVKSQVLAVTNGTILLPKDAESREVRRLLLVSQKHLKSQTVKGDVIVKAGDFIRVGQALDNKGTLSVDSAQVESIDGKTIHFHIGRPYLISPGTQLQAENNGLSQQGDLIATLIFERQKTGDIVQGLPKVEELLEGRKPKEIAVLAPFDAKVETVRDEELVRVYLIDAESGRTEVSIPLGANVLVEDGQFVKAGDQITDGSVNPHELLEIKGVEAVSQFLVEEVQRVYRSQGVEIADKHLEIIVRQMTRKVRIDESGDTFLLGGELVDMKVLNEANRQAEEQGLRPAVYSPVLLGITKASLNTESFISAASFQETTRVLTEAAVEGRIDMLRGLKENVIIGRLIPAGTGFPQFKDQRRELEQDDSANKSSNARKPSAILEEIESMFGSPDVESFSDFLLDDSFASSMGMHTEEEDELFSQQALTISDDDLIG
jgi:DNA-directed RNA polymerase subunit beta'